MMTESRPVSRETGVAPDFLIEPSLTFGGPDIFAALVQKLAETLRVRYAFIGTLHPTLPRHIMPVAFWVGERLVDTPEYDLRGTPCERVVADDETHYFRSGVAEVFPDDIALIDMGIESYLGTPMRTPSGQMLGLLSVMHSEPTSLLRKEITIVELFASLAGAELARQRTESALRKGAERFRFLAEASSLLSSSLDYETTLAQTAKLAVPLLADSCIVVSIDEQGRLHRLAVCHVDAEIERALRALSPSVNLGSTDLSRLTSQVAAGELVWMPEVSDTDWRAAIQDADGDTAECLRLQDAHSYMLVPMSARGRTLGAMMFVTSRRFSRRTYAQEDVELAAELAHRAALAFDNARLYRDLRREQHRKDAFLATLAHELRNPMAGISNALHVLQLPELEEQTRSHALAIAIRQASQQARLIDDLLDVSRITRGKINLQKRPLELGEALHAIIEAKRSAFEQRGQTLIADLPREPSWVFADATRFEQVITNLLDNASKYSPSGGEAHVELRTHEGEAVIRVVDDGHGIEPELLPRVFDIFIQAPAQQGAVHSGLGVGLTIVKQLIELHGGSIMARSQGKGCGSEFGVRLPLLPSSAAHESAEEETTGDPGARLRILVVDDNEDAADALGILLDAWGHDAQIAYSGSTAIEVAERFKPHLALVDIAMPGMDGYATAQALRQLPGARDLCLVALTGYGQQQDIDKSWAAGFTHHLTKPTDPGRVQAIIKELHASHGARAPRSGPAAR